MTSVVSRAVKYFRMFVSLHLFMFTDVCVCVCVFGCVYRCLYRSGMLDIVHLWNNEVEVFYDGQIVNQKRIYSQRLVRTDGSSIYKTIGEKRIFMIKFQGNSVAKMGNLLLNF